MYYFLDKQNANNLNKTDLAKKVGINIATLSRILNQKQNCSKMLAYCISKAINKNAEINDFFENVK
jgi:DNA-binding XRE family transcriptional regulator